MSRVLPKLTAVSASDLDHLGEAGLRDQFDVDLGVAPPART